MENLLSDLSPISRARFLKNMGITGGALLAALCMGGLSSCAKTGVTPSAKNFSLDLSDPVYASLKITGNYLVTQDVVIVCKSASSYVAVTVICSHEGQKRVAFRKATNDFYCSAHGANFDINGNGLNNTGAGGLTVYKAVLTGSILKITS